jgi:hypothetical protein
MPLRRDQTLTERFGAEVAGKLLPVVKFLEEEFYLSDAKSTAPNLSEMGELAVRDFRRRHPEMPDKIAEALAWCYTFDFR